jgi:phage shock protein PspC (stress-responsive transcriptional regulator)
MGNRNPGAHSGAMSDESTTDDTAEGAPTEELPPPPLRPPAPRPLRRSNSDRVIAGVCGGTAEYFAIDPIIVRLGFVALALLGGSGVLLYLIAWLVMPGATENESAAINALRGGRRAGGRSLLALALLIVGIVVLSGTAFLSTSFAEGLFVPLLILAAGVALLVWPAEGPGRRSRFSMDDDQWRDERRAVRDEWRREREAWRESRQHWRHGYRQGPHVPWDAATAPPPPAPPPPAPAPARPLSPRPFLAPLAIALLLLFTGLTVFADRLGWWSTDPASFLAASLVIIGAVLVLSAFVGRARGLIWLGVFLLPITWGIATIDLTWWNGIGEETIIVTTIDELEESYRWGIGEFTVDLSDLDLRGDRELAVGLTIGELTIYVPETMGVEIDLAGRAGSLNIRDRGDLLTQEGFDIGLDRVTGDPAAGTLTLDVDLGLGRAEVIVCGPGGVPCP